MAPNPTCGPDTVVISGFSDPIPRLLYAKVTDVSGCSAYDEKVVQILANNASGYWYSDDDELVIQFGFSPSTKSLLLFCIGDMPPSPAVLFGSYSTPVNESFPNSSLECCGTVDIHIGEAPP